MRIITPPASQVIGLEELKQDLRVAYDDDDSALDRMLSDATEWVERRTQTAMLTQTREIDLASFPPVSVNLFLSRPVQSIVSVKYYDPTNVQQTANPTGYYLLGDTIVPIGSWPIGTSITVRFIAGYTSAAFVPSSLKAAVRMKVQELFDDVDMSAAIDNLLLNHLYLVA